MTTTVPEAAGRRVEASRRPSRPREAATEPTCRLDDFMPAYDFNEVHAMEMRTSPEVAFRSILDVTPGEICFFQLLTAVRSLNPVRLLGRWTGGDASRADVPIVDSALASGFVLLAREPGRELVIGTVGQFWKIHGGRSVRLAGAEAFRSFGRPGYAKAAMNFLIEEEEPGWCRVTTETRILGLDPASSRQFGRYWPLVRPGSALIRSMWLRAVERR